MKWKYTFCFSFIITLCFAQKNDNIWLLGYDSNPSQLEFGGTVIDFSISPPNIYYQFRNMDLAFTNASICDINGNLLFYTNGGYIADAIHEPMENGLNLSPGAYANDFNDSGFRIPQAAIIISFEGNDSLFYLFHSNIEYPDDEHPSFVRGLYYSQINRNGNNGLGKVIEKNQLVIEDTLTHGKMVATKHANGRDWWIVIPQYDVFRYHTILATPDTIIVNETEDLEPNITGLEGSVGVSSFSPDGTKYARHDLRFLPEGNTLDIYDFDRCTGDLSNNIHIKMGDTTGIRGGVAFSQNSRFLYAFVKERIYQFDLWAADVETSQTIVAEYDGYMSYFETQFNSGQLAPDGKIYITTPATDNILHRINLPNHIGVNCDIEQHAITLPTINNRYLPNYPNFRLGAIDGSSCDTLGLDNHPLAGFTWETDGLTAIFSDNSYYNPIDWSWGFGDTETDTAPNPIHTFPEEGIYVVCLAVTNENSSDTICQEVIVSTLKADFSFEADELAVSFMDASISEPLEWHWDFGDNATNDMSNPNHNYLAEGDYEVCLTVIDEWASDTHCDSVSVMIIDNVLEQKRMIVDAFPNPAIDKITILLSSSLINGTIKLSDITGKEVSRTLVEENSTQLTIGVSQLPQGVYWLNILDDDTNVFTEKVVITR